MNQAPKRMDKSAALTNQIHALGNKYGLDKKNSRNKEDETCLIRAERSDKDSKHGNPAFVSLFSFPRL
jgi:hypothetical protein